MPALRSLVAVLFIVLTASCARDASPPQLIDVYDIVPSSVEAGDRVEILGTAFPQGKHAKLTFRGELRRAGEKPERAEIVAEGETTSGTQIELDFTEGLQELFCGVGEAAIHTTFTGDVEVSLAAASAGAPPVNASLHAVSLDVRAPSTRRALIEARERQGEKALAFMGIRPQKTAPASGGILVDTVIFGSRAEKAGIVANDLLTSLDKARILSLADVLPQPGRAVAALGIRRGASATEITREVPMDGFRASVPPELYAAVVLVAVAVAGILFFLAPTVGALTWLERRFAARLGSSIGVSQPEAPGFPRAANLWGLLRGRAGSDSARALHVRLAPYLLVVALSACLVAMPFGQYLIVADSDVGILFILAIVPLIAVGLLSDASASNRDRSMIRTVRRTASILSYQVPSAIAVACVVMMAGSLRLQEIIRAQGGWPWEWFLFRTPVTFTLFFVYFAAVLAEGNRWSPGHLPAENDLAVAPSSPAPGSRSTLLLFAERAGVFVICGVAAASFLGGWEVPGLSAGAQEAHLGLQLLGALVFLAKTWSLVAAVVWGRLALPRVSVARGMAVCWKALVPIAVVGFALSAAWVSWTPGRATQTAIGVLVFAVACVGFARVAHRVRHGVRVANAEGHLNPFL